MSKILITGGGGYVGSMLSTALVNLGHEVTVIDLMKYDRGSLNHLHFYKNFKLIKKDVRNKNLLKSSLISCLLFLFLYLNKSKSIFL